MFGPVFELSRHQKNGCHGRTTKVKIKLIKKEGRKEKGSKEDRKEGMEERGTERKEGKEVS